jgi:hypothetical protein
VVRRLALLAVCGLLLLGLVAAPARAGDDAPAPTAPTTLPLLPDDAGRIVKRPNYGHEPTGPNDRGGWQQVMVLGLLCTGVGGVAAFAWRDARRRRRRAAGIPH